MKFYEILQILVLYDFVAFRNGGARFANHWNCKFKLECV